MTCFPLNRTIWKTTWPRQSRTLPPGNAEPGALAAAGNHRRRLEGAPALDGPPPLQRWIAGYAQVDPKVEYKREGMRIFEQMWDSSGERVTDLIFRMEELDEGFVGSTWTETNAVHEEAPGASEIATQQQEAIDGMQSSDKKPEPFRKRQKSIGRNAPCPCGSGKKFKTAACEKADRRIVAFRSAKVACATGWQQEPQVAGGPDVFPRWIVHASKRFRKNVWVPKAQEDPRTRSQTARSSFQVVHCRLSLRESSVRNQLATRPSGTCVLFAERTTTILRRNVQN